MATKIITVEATPPSESTGADYNKGAPLNAAEFDQNIVNLRAAVDRKASLNNPTFTGTVTLPSTTSIGDVSATELQYLNSVTSNVQDQINAKAPINNPTFTGTASLSGGTANGVLYLNGSKQVTSGSGLVFDSSGNLGIGTASPSYKLDVQSASAVTANFQSTAPNSYGIMQIVGNNRGGELDFYNGATAQAAIVGVSSNLYFYTNGNSSLKMTLDSSGNLTITGSTATKASGTTWANPSDQRLKDNIRDYEKGLVELLQVRVREWEYNGKGGTTDGLKGLGVVADEIETILPNTVETYEAKLEETDEEVTTIKKFDATEITWLLVNAVKEQQSIIESQAQTIESLTQRIEALEYTKQGE